MAGKRHTTEDKFVAWLSPQIPSKQLSEMYLRFMDLEPLLKKYRIIQKTFFEISEPAKVDEVRKMMDNCPSFLRVHKSRLKQMNQALVYYQKYLLEEADNIKQEANLEEYTANLPNRANKSITENAKCVAELAVPREKQMQTRSEDLIIAALKKECSYTALGVTLDYLAFWVNQYSKDEIKEILAHSPYAQLKNGRYFYVELKVPQEQSSKVNPKSLSIDFTNLPQMRYTQPLTMIYCGNDVPLIYRSWAEVYVELVKCLREDYPDRVISDIRWRGTGHPDLGKKMAMGAPKWVWKDIYLETRFSADDLIRKIRDALNYCGVSYESIAIQYESKCSPKTVDEDAEEKTVFRLDFDNAKMFSSMKPQKLTYFGEDVPIEPLWSVVYVRLIKTLYEDYPIRLVAGAKWGNGNRPDLGDGSGMAAPSQVANGLFVETWFSGEELILKIRDVLEFCNIDSEFVVIDCVKRIPVQKQSSPLTKAENQEPPKLETAEGAQNKFREWMDSQGLGVRTCLNYAVGLVEMDGFLYTRKLSKKRIWEMDTVQEIEQCLSDLTNNPEFVTKNNSSHHQYSASIRKYIEFKKDTTQRSDALSNEVKILSDSVGGITQHREESPIDALLRDDIYSTLREALAAQKIRTVEELKQMKLWIFMNQHNLYSIAARQKVLLSIQKLLAATEEQSNAQQCKIVLEMAKRMSAQHRLKHCLLCANNYRISTR